VGSILLESSECIRDSLLVDAIELSARLRFVDVVFPGGAGLSTPAGRRNVGFLSCSPVPVFAKAVEASLLDDFRADRRSNPTDVSVIMDITEAVGFALRLWFEARRVCCSDLF
jgi:hypothetical protein